MAVGKPPNDEGFVTATGAGAPKEKTLFPPGGGCCR